MNTEITLKSKIDTSINNIVHIGPLANDIVETRIVQRTPETLIIYLSTHTGCANSCRMCWLTQTKQVSSKSLSIDQILDQLHWASGVIERMADIQSIKNIHINFMARGDALSNPNLMMTYHSLYYDIQSKMDSIFFNRVRVLSKISTIFPTDCVIDLTNGGMKHWVDKFGGYDDYSRIGTEFYYSLYSLNNDFRRKWLPKATHPHHVGEIFTGSRPDGDYNPFRLHHALIADENDSLKDADAILEWLNKYDIICALNIVRYNPFDTSCGEESPMLDVYAEYIAQSPRISQLQIIPRVGKDVNASCGTFMTPDVFT